MPAPLCNELISALKLEIAAIRAKGGQTQVGLRGGMRVGSAGGGYLYRFPVSEDANLRDDTPVKLKFGDQEVSGVLVSFRNGILVVSVEQDLGPEIPTAQLVVDNAFLLERLAERLEKSKIGEIPFNKASAERVLGVGTPKIAEGNPVPSVFEGSGSINEDQRRAVRMSFGSDTIYVWGPPGTGKTTTLARIVEAHYRAGRSVLLVSNTNLAVDTALEKISDRLKGESAFHVGLVIRQGPVVKEELRRQYGPQVILEEIVARHSEKIQHERTTLTEEDQKLTVIEKEYEPKIQNYDKLDWIIGELQAKERQAKRAAEERAKREAEAQRHRARANELTNRLERARTMSAFRRFFTGIDPVKDGKELQSANFNETACRNAGKALDVEATKLATEITKYQDDFVVLKQVTIGYKSKAELKQASESNKARRKQIRERIETIDKELAALEQKILGNCRILATTVYRTYLAKAVMRTFDVVVIDEASMLMPPLVYYAAGLATSSVTVTGDFRQLPPIVTTKEPAALKWLRKDVFELSGIPEHLAKREQVPKLVSLGVQHRMREPICSVINDLFYADHPLRSGANVHHDGVGFPFGPSALMYVDTSTFRPWASCRVGTYSRYNLFHALLIRNIVMFLAESGYLPVATESNDALGVTSPFAAQSRLIQALLEDRLGSRATGIAATVHRFQGNEKKVMIVDLTSSHGVSPGGFLKSTSIEEDGARLINVAISRSRHHVVLVGNFDYLRSKLPENAHTRLLLDQFVKNGTSLDVTKALSLTERDWVEGFEKILPPSFEISERTTGVFNEGNFYRAFQQDLSRAKESIVIFSPFATTNGTGRWGDLFRNAVGRGAKVRILMKPPVEAGGGTPEEVEGLIHELRKLAVAVDLRARMHEKVAVIDGRIVWHGSLNILSHKNTLESMFRVDSSVLADHFSDLASSSKKKAVTSVPFHDSENPTCPKCSGGTVMQAGQYGIYFTCEKNGCDGKVDPKKTWGQGNGGGARKLRAGSSKRGDKTAASKPCPATACDGRLVVRNGKRGSFLGCTNYPSCSITENI